MSSWRIVYYCFTVCAVFLKHDVVRSEFSVISMHQFEFSETDREYIQGKVTLARKYLFPKEESRTRTRLSKSGKCLACKLMTSTLQELIVEKRPEEEMVKICTAVCIDASIEDERVCHYITRQYKDMAIGTIQKLLFSPDEICGMILGPSCAVPYNPLEMWNVTLPNTPKPPVTPPRPPAPKAPRMKFLQLTDIHIDLMYEAGRNADCGEPLCCRSNDGEPAPGDPGAGIWGDYRNCDVPLTLVDNLFQHLASKADQFDFIIFTGDIAAHDVWNQSRSDQVSALERLVSYFEEYLPGIPVYFCAGNHDSSPCDSFPPPYITGNNSVAWMYDAMSTHWSQLGRLPADTKETIMRGGFYTVSPFPGFRIISVNNIFCYSGNWWLLINTTDPAGQLHWLAQTLQKEEDRDEKVFILQHTPSDCMKAWSWNYYKIVSRYESTIVGQFNGHTHTDEFRVYYDVDDLTRPVNVAYVGGAVTPYSNRNPNYRIYTMDGVYHNSSYAVLDYEDYVFDLRKNTESKGSWEYEYSPLTDYGMNSSYPRDWNDLIYRMKDDDDLFKKFHRHISKGGDLTPCDHVCKLNMLCTLKSGRSLDPDLCKDLQMDIL